MKFGKLLQSTVDEMPEMSEVFLRYRELKKQLKRMPHAESGSRTGDEDLQHHFQERLSSSCPAELATPWGSDRHAAKGLDPRDEQSFIDTLSEDLHKLNDFFMNKEEDIVIRLQDLEDRSNSISTPEEQQHLKSAFVKLHGEMVLLLHWSLLNFAAVVKILKKHDKQTGIVLRGPVLSSVLQQPFYSTDSITKLVKIAEAKVKQLSGEGEPDAGAQLLQSDRSQEFGLIRRTQAALEMWREMGEKASTPSTTYVQPAGKRIRVDKAS
ncbi:hypothetical protein WJX74_006199 [Apatococcus lobatus]|uniref:SPX domain-containing protein n=2 Tax=Apatococcus TaxID=904362 RepID=A0AAW1SX42_9CHLO